MSHDGDADDVSNITWPGFVDIMSSTILMFIFFVLITSVALYFHTITYKSKLLAQVQEMAKAESKETTQDISKENQQMKEKIEEITQENQSLAAKVTAYEDIIKKTDADFALSKDQKVDISLDNSSITIFFGKDAISLTEESIKLMDEFLKKFLTTNNPQNVKVYITGSKNPQALTESLARRLVLARMLNTRNAFLKTAIPKDKIFVNMVDDEKIEDTYNWVKIVLDTKG